MVYNLTNVSKNTVGLLSLFQMVNSELMGGWLGVCLLIVIVSIVFISFQFSTGNISKSLPATSFLSVGFAILLRLVNLLPDLALFITIILAAITLALGFISKD